MKKIVKISTPWNHDLLKRTPGGKGVFGNYKFEFDDACSECDYWIVWGGLKGKEKTKCPPQNVIYLTDETHEQRKFNESFLIQFSTVLACRKDVVHPHVIFTHDLGIWHFDKSYDEVVSMNASPKTKIVSVVSSDYTVLPGHKKRFAYVNQMMGHFKDRVDYYGKGINPIPDKLQGISDYQYSVAIENSYIPGYFTEKLFECFLTNTFPIYYGCPDLENYFDAKAFARIDIADYTSSFQITEEIIREGMYAERAQYLREAKEIYLKKYYIFPALIDIIERTHAWKDTNRKSPVTLLPERYFQLPSHDDHFQESLMNGKQGLHISSRIFMNALKFKFKQIIGASNE